MVQELSDARSPAAEREAQEAAGQCKILEEIPEDIATRARASQSKIAALPKLLPEERGRGAVYRENERCRAISDPDEDTQRHHHFDAEADQDRKPRQGSIAKGKRGLNLRIAEIQQLVERAERQEQKNQKAA